MIANNTVLFRCRLRLDVVVLLFTAWLMQTEIARGESALDLLSGFDTERLDRCFPVEDSESAGELSRLLYRIRRIAPDVLADRAEPMSDDLEPGDATTVQGRIHAVRQYRVPESLAEFLDMTAFQEIVIRSESSEHLHSVFAPPLKGRLSQDDRITANVVVIRQSDASDAFAAGDVSWTPAQTDKVGWNLLATQDVDLGPIAEAASRNRRPLESDDGDAFYSLLAAAKTIAQKSSGDADTLPEPLSVKPTELLLDPTPLVGQWIRINASTVRVTKVTVSTPRLANQLGQDHYYQIDASGDLGKTIVKLKRAEGDPGGPIEMSGYYPLSFVATTLPDFLNTEFEKQNAVVSMVNQPIAVDGFFFRLWSYENEFMSKQNAGKQVGPLIVASRIRSTLPKNTPGDDVRWIGYLMAGGIVIAVFGTFAWSQRNARQDAAVRQTTSGSVKIDL